MKLTKNIKKIILTLLVVLTLFITGCDKKEENLGDIESNLSFKEEYESINNEDTGYGKTYRELHIEDDSMIVYTDLKNLNKMIEKKETFIVYFGFKECPWCRSIVETMLKEAKKNKIDKIYYVSIKDLRDTYEIQSDDSIKKIIDASPEYYSLLQKLQNVLEDYTLTKEDGTKLLVGEKRIYAPNTILVKEGKATKIVTNSPLQTDSYQELSKEILEDTKDLFDALYKEYKK